MKPRRCKECGGLTLNGFYCKRCIRNSLTNEERDNKQIIDDLIFTVLTILGAIAVIKVMFLIPIELLVYELGNLIKLFGG